MKKSLYLLIILFTAAQATYSSDIVYKNLIDSSGFNNSLTDFSDISPVRNTNPNEGLMRFNEETQEMEVYTLLSDNIEITNNSSFGNYTHEVPSIDAWFKSDIEGKVVAIDLLIRSKNINKDTRVEIKNNGSYKIPKYSEFSWHRFELKKPIIVNSKDFFNLYFDGPAMWECEFATNNDYVDGFVGCCISDNDIMFRLHIKPDKETYSWKSVDNQKQ